MTLWDQLVQIQPSVFDHLRNMYGENFPLEIRQYLAEWLEMKFVNSVPDNEQSVECIIFFDQFLEQLQLKASQMEFDIVSYRLKASARKIRQIYSQDPLQLYKHLRKCFQHEVNLLRNPNILLQRNNSEDSELQNALKMLLQQTVEIEKENRTLKHEFEVFCLDYHEVSKFNEQSEHLLMQRPDAREWVDAKRNESNQKLQHDLNLLTQKKINLTERFTKIVMDTEAAEKVVIGKYLNEWTMNQKIIAAGGNVKSFLTLDTLQNWCESLAQILWSTREQVKILINSVHQVPSTEQLLSKLPEIIDSISKLLENLITRCFIIEKQPPQVIGIKKKFESSVRLLIGNKLNINMGNPQVVAEIISERQAKELQTAYQSNENCENIINNVGYMEYNATTKHMSMKFNNLLLPKMPKEMSKIRKERSGSESVVDKKFALLFQSIFTIGHGEMMYCVWALSMPIVVTSHTNQKPEAWATITWDNAFAEFIREPFVVPDRVSVIRLADALNMKFRMKTGRCMTEENLHFLCEKVTRMQLPMPLIEGYEVSWMQFCKEPLPNRDFTFWTWFYKTMKLTKKYLRGPWNDGLINGFVDRERVHEKLSNCLNGTFLLRFAESELGGVTIAVKQNNFVEHIEPFIEQVLKIRSLADSIRDLSYLNYLYPNKPVQEAFAKYMTPKQINVKGNYVKSELRMAVLTASNSNQDQEQMGDISNNQEILQNEASNFGIALPNFEISFPGSPNFQVFTSTC